MQLSYIVGCITRPIAEKINELVESGRDPMDGFVVTFQLYGKHRGKTATIMLDTSKGA